MLERLSPHPYLGIENSSVSLPMETVRGNSPLLGWRISCPCLVLFLLKRKEPGEEVFVCVLSKGVLHFPYLSGVFLVSWWRPVKTSLSGRADPGVWSAQLFHWHLALKFYFPSISVFSSIFFYNMTILTSRFEEFSNSSYCLLLINKLGLVSLQNKEYLTFEKALPIAPCSSAFY
jgi:hypothetical protein